MVWTNQFSLTDRTPPATTSRASLIIMQFRSQTKETQQNWLPSSSTSTHACLVSPSLDTAHQHRLLLARRPRNTASLRLFPAWSPLPIVATRSVLSAFTAWYPPARSPVPTSLPRNPGRARPAHPLNQPDTRSRNSSCTSSGLTSSFDLLQHYSGLEFWE